MAGIKDYGDWRAVNALWFLGNLSLNLANTFYYAGFPAVVRNVPEIRQSEREVFEGLKTPEEHAQFDSLSRAKVSDLPPIYQGIDVTKCISSTITALAQPRLLTFASLE
jgi:hypothetical protein